MVQFNNIMCVRTCSKMKMDSNVMALLINLLP